MRFRALLTTVMIAAMPTVGHAGDLCVVCTEPAATYRCEAGASGISGAAAQVACIKDIAKRGGHQSCTLERTRGNSACSGSLVTLDQPGANPVGPGTHPGGVASGSVTPNDGVGAVPPAVAKPKEGPPATVEALAKATIEQTKETTEAAGQNIKKAGSAVGSAVKKSWDCVVSLFSAC